MLNKKALAATAAAAEPVYVEDVFSTYLYSGNSSTQTITNNIDLSGEGGAVWIKQRNTAEDHRLQDTVRGTSSGLQPNLTNAAQTWTNYITAFNNNGFSLGANVSVNGSGNTYASWTFRKAEKFFDVVTWTGNNASTRQISHNLGSVPGCIIVKITSGANDNWIVYHRSLGNTKVLRLNLTNAETTQDRWANTDPTSTYFTVALNQETNQTGCTYVAYLFAHDAGGFGDDGSQNVISCGSFTTDGSGNATVTLGYEPQWVMYKRTDSTSNWAINDSMRGLVVGGTETAELYANLSSAEGTGGLSPTSTGFTTNIGASRTYIYIAIRRGPMKTPTSSTSVFSPATGTYSSGTVITTNFPVDSLLQNIRTGASDNTDVVDRLRGVPTTNTTGGPYLTTSSTAAENTTSNHTRFWTNTGYSVGGTGAGNSTVYYAFGRAPGFFDVVCYTGTGSATTVSHNLGVAPELMIFKRRSLAASWFVTASVLGNNNGYPNFLYLNQTAQTQLGNSNSLSSDPTATSISFGGGNAAVNGSGDTYVAYLFASLSGVSKVGSYTGNGSSQTINCGFTAGARFIMIKRTDNTGDWYVYDSARGIVSGNDPQLKLNTTDAEATGYDAIDPDNSGFIVNNDATNFPINVNNATYIYLAIA